MTSAPLSSGEESSHPALSLLSLMRFASGGLLLRTSEGDPWRPLSDWAARQAEEIVCSTGTRSVVHEYLYAEGRVEYLVVHNGTREFDVRHLLLRIQ